MTYSSPSSCSVLMSKFTLVSPTRWLCPRARSLTLCRRCKLSLQLLDPLLGVRRLVVERSELDEPLVGVDRDGQLARLLRCVRKLELRGGIARLELRDLRVDVGQLLRSRLPLAQRLAVALARLGTDRLRDRVGDVVECP